MSNLLSVRDLYKSFLEGEKEISILRGLDLDLNHGERLAVVGESGVGKSTLLDLIQCMDLARARSEAERLLEMVGLKDRMSHRPGKLSGGEQQRVAVARSVILEPKLILADEPTGSLDLRIGEEVQDLLFRLNEEKGIALVVATHNRDFAKKIGRQVELREGRLFPV